jgi:signal transduction histidine kinase
MPKELSDIHSRGIRGSCLNVALADSPYIETGMGLAICKKIVNRYGGEITVRNIPGQGTTFIVSLPIEQKAGA